LERDDPGPPVVPDRSEQRKPWPGPPTWAAFISLDRSLGLADDYVTAKWNLQSTKYQGVRGSVWNPDTLRERVGDWGGPETIWNLLCVAERRATRPNGEWGYSSSIDMYNNDGGK